MKNAMILAFAFVLCGVVYVSKHGGLPTPAPYSPPPAGAENFRTIFARVSDKVKARDHARALAAIAEAAKEILAHDWRAGGTPTITQAHQIAKIRQMIRDGSMNGWSFITLYPEIGPTLDTFFTQRVGRDPGQLSAQDRERWLATFSELFVAVAWAADNL